MRNTRPCDCLDQRSGSFGLRENGDHKRATIHADLKLTGYIAGQVPVCTEFVY